MARVKGFSSRKKHHGKHTAGVLRDKEKQAKKKEARAKLRKFDLLEAQMEDLRQKIAEYEQLIAAMGAEPPELVLENEDLKNKLKDAERQQSLLAQQLREIVDASGVVPVILGDINWEDEAEVNRTTKRCRQVLAAAFKRSFGTNDKLWELFVEKEASKNKAIVDRILSNPKIAKAAQKNADKLMSSKATVDRNAQASAVLRLRTNVGVRYSRSSPCS